MWAILLLITQALAWSLPGDIANALTGPKVLARMWPQEYEARYKARHGHDLLKRYYGVQAMDATTKKYPSVYQPWPVTCSAPEVIQTVKYCFVDKRSANNLGKIVDAGVAKWAQAMLVSSLRFDLAPSAVGDPMRLCTELDPSDFDALAIRDVTVDGDKEWNNGASTRTEVDGHGNGMQRSCSTDTTTGYTYTGSDMGGNHRHQMRWCMRDPDAPPAESSDAWFENTLAMAHELGHALGLSHEHQRPDRGDHLWVYYRRLEGYDEMLKAVDLDEQGFFDNPYDEHDPKHAEFKPWTDKEKQTRACSDELIASHYFPQALEFLRGHAYTSDLKKDQWASYKYSQDFDYDSIMIYSSTLGVPAGSTKYSMTRKTGNGKEPVWTGGNPDRAKAGISKGDVARVAMLYDNHTPECEAAKKGWGEATEVVVRIRDSAEVVVPPPGNGTRDEL